MNPVSVVGEETSNSVESCLLVGSGSSCKGQVHSKSGISWLWEMMYPRRLIESVEITDFFSLKVRMCLLATS